MEEFINEVFGSYAGLVLSVMGVCAAVSALLLPLQPASRETDRARVAIRDNVFFIISSI